MKALLKGALIFFCLAIPLALAGEQSVAGYQLNLNSDTSQRAIIKEEKHISITLPSHEQFIQLPFIELSYDFHQQQFDPYPNNNYYNVKSRNPRIQVPSENVVSWYADLYNGSEQVGFVHFTSHSNQSIAGTLQIDNQAFNIERTEDRSHITALSTGLSNNYHHPFHSELSYEGSITMEGSVNNVYSSSCTRYDIKVLALYTPNAKEAGGSVSAVEARINHAISQTNNAFFNSEIYNIQLQLAATEEIAFTETQNISSDLQSLMNNSTVSSRRSVHNADIVVLFTKANYTLGGGGGGGCLGPHCNIFGNTIFGATPVVGARQHNAFAIVQYENAIDQTYTFAHEVGHLLGAQHGRNDGHLESNPIYPNAYAHAFNSTHGLTHTILKLNTATDGSTRIPHYSNPAVRYSGRITGTSTSNNSLAIRNHGPIVARFYEPNVLASNLNIFQLLNTSGHNLVGTACGGSGNYTYRWYSSNTPLSFPSNPFATGQSTIINLNNGYTYIKLEVSDSAGSTVSYLESVYYDESTQPLP